LLKPILGLAASFALVFVLVYYPVSYFSQKELVKTPSTETFSTDAMDIYSLTIALIDENVLINTIINEDKTSNEEINYEEVVAYLSADMNDIEIYSEIQN
jgi:hypothetical protein